MKRILFLIAVLLTAVLSSEAQSFPLDYSQVGYKQSTQSIPDAPVVVYVDWQSGDQSARIQSAIDDLSKRKVDKRTGLRGAILLGKGTFELSEPLRISADGIVIRGSGRNETTLYKKGVDRGAVVYIEGRTGLVTGDTISPSSARVGDDVIVWRQSTKEWIQKLGCSDFGGGKDLGYWGWHPGEIDVYWTRRIASKKGDSIEFDVPLSMSKAQLDDVRIIKVISDKRVKNSGIENLTIDCETDSTNPKDEDHAWDGVYIANATDCWVRVVNFRHLAGSAVITQRTASQVTVEDCISTDPVSEIGGYRRRTFYCMGERCLFQRLYSEHGIHDFAAGLCAAGPNVFSQCDSYESFGYSGSLGPWCTGLLFDCVNIDGNDLKLAFNGLEGYGSGWSTANSTAYQCTASGIFSDSVPDGSNNYVYGCWAQFNGNGSFAECNNHVKPWSLFAQELATRTDSANSSRICRTLVRQLNSVSNNPTYAQAQQMAALACIPRTTMKMWIDSARLSASVLPPSHVLRLPPAHYAPSAHYAHPYPAHSAHHRPLSHISLSQGHLLLNGSLIVGRRQNAPWWNGRVRYSAFPKMPDGVTRFVPGMEGEGTTTRIDSVAAHLKANHIAWFNQNYGLWYDRRRDDHERIRRRDGDVWAPFYEQTFARSGQGTAWDGLSKYDLTKLSKWYIYRVKKLAEATGDNGTIILNQHYFQHNILEAGAHWVDCPWRPVNNINGTVFPEPVPFAGDKRVYMAEYFYDITNPVMARLHRQYITNMLDAFADEPNIVHSIGEEYTGPYHFTKFWLQTVGEWEQRTGKHVLVALSCNKNIQDSIMQDPALAKVVDIINIEQWWQTSKGLYAPLGGKNMAPRQYFRRMRPGKVTFKDVYSCVRECRDKWQDKAVVYYGSAYDQFGWAVLMAGGSCPSIPVTANDFLKDVAIMSHASAHDGIYTLSNDEGEALVYVDAEAKAPSFGLNVSSMVVSSIDEKTGKISKPISIESSKTNWKPTSGIYWIRKK